MPKIMKKVERQSRYSIYLDALTRKSDELRRSMSAQNAAQVVARLDCPSDEGDLSQQSHEEWIFLNRNSLDVKLLRDVQEALRRAELDNFGVCQECEQPISEKRLNAVPWAKYCVTCQQKIGSRAAGTFSAGDDD